MTIYTNTLSIQLIRAFSLMCLILEFFSARRTAIVPKPQQPHEAHYGNVLRLAHETEHPINYFEKSRTH